MDLDLLYSSIIKDLKNGKRPHKKALPLEFEDFFFQLWDLSLQNQDWESFKKCLCICEFSQFQNLERLQEYILKSYQQTTLPKELLIFLLGCSQIYLIEVQRNQNQKVSMDFINQLKILLKHKDLEVVEWTLRCICDLGKQNLFLKEDVILLSLPKHLFFSKNFKMCLELRDHLKYQWRL